MAKKIKVYYSKIRNMGDELNELIIEKCFGYKVERHSFLDGELCAIGSCLGMYTLHGTVPMRMQQRINGVQKPHVSIWGTGFINYTDSEGKFFKKNMEFCAVRGELTRKAVSGMVKKKLDIPTADPGILASEVLDSLPKKRYQVGIVPHLCDLQDPQTEKLLSRYDNACLINVKDDPLEVVREIARCRCILSSSLHGLIVADSLGIPNLHIEFGDRLLGDGYKFDDYYSAYGITHCSYDIRTMPFPEIGWIEEQYKICPEVVEEKKKALQEVFPFPARKELDDGRKTDFGDYSYL